MCHCVEVIEDVRAEGSVNHPDSPRGGGGPGLFTSASPLAGVLKPGGLPHPRSPASRLLDPMKAAKLSKQQGPVQVVTRAPPIVLEENHQTLQGIAVTVRPDAHGITSITQGAVTNYDPQMTGQVTFSWDNHDRVVSFENTVRWSVSIQTRYRSGVSASAPSAYGRGTTALDRSNGNTTLGFHEGMHRQDYLAYMRTTPVPQFSGTVGMTKNQFQQRINAYYAAWNAYFRDMEQNSEAATDEVGDPTRSHWQHCQTHPGATNCP